MAAELRKRRRCWLITAGVSNVLMSGTSGLVANPTSIDDQQRYCFEESTRGVLPGGDGEVEGDGCGLSGIANGCPEMNGVVWAWDW